MSDRHKNILKSFLGISFATLLSRLLGLARVMLESAVLGGGAIASAWQLAFMWPNLFRRLLGEGALGTALIPLITHTEATHGRDQVRADLSIIFLVLSALLALISVAISAGALLLQRVHHQEHIELALQLIPLLMPYTIFICLIGVIGAVLNTRKTFFLPALGALLLNIFLIGGLWVLPHENMPRMLRQLSVLVLFSGALQLLFMLILLWRKGVFPALTRNIFDNRKVLKELWNLTLPGLIGGSALQISFIIDRLLAASLGDQAVPALVYTDRIIDLPIGIFAISFGSVLMTNMAHSAAHNNIEEMRSDLLFGLRQVYFICVPMAFFVVFFHEPLLRLLLMRGNFTDEDLVQTSQAAIFFGAGIPAFCSLKVILPAFYARKEMRKPLYVSLGCITLNIILNLLLMGSLRQGGIALATVLASIANNGTLLWLLRKEGIRIEFKTLFITLLRAGVAAAAASLAWVLYPYLGFFGQWIQFGLGWAIFSGIYLLVSALLRGPELHEFIQLFIRRHNKRKQENHG